MNKKEDIPELLLLQEACDILKCHPNTLRKWDEGGVLKAVRFGPRNDRKYTKKSILKFISESKD